MANEQIASVILSISRSTVPSRRGKIQPPYRTFDVAIICERTNEGELLNEWKSETNRVNSMPFKVYEGKTGVVYNVTKPSVRIIL